MTDPFNTDYVPLSRRVRPNGEAAPWVVDSIEAMEKVLDECRAEMAHLAAEARESQRQQALDAALVQKYLGCLQEVEEDRRILRETVKRVARERDDMFGAHKLADEALQEEKTHSRALRGVIATIAQFAEVSADDLTVDPSLVYRMAEGLDRAQDEIARLKDTLAVERTPPTPERWDAERMLREKAEKERDDALKRCESLQRVADNTAYQVSEGVRTVEFARKSQYRAWSAVTMYREALQEIAAKVCEIRTGCEDNLCASCMARTALEKLK